MADLRETTPSFTEQDRVEWGQAVERYRAGEITEAEYRAAQRRALVACNRGIVDEYMAMQGQEVRR